MQKNIRKMCIQQNLVGLGWGAGSSPKYNTRKKYNENVTVLCKT